MTNLEFESRFSDSSWFYPISSRYPVQHSNDPSKDAGYLRDNQRKLFLDRYFNVFVLPDVGREPFNDICVLFHSNSVCTVGLAPGHHLFRGCSDGSSSGVAEQTPHRLLGVDFDLGRNVNRLANSVSGRRKRGGQSIGRAPHVFAHVLCDRNVRHRLILGVPGRLVEVNHELAYDDSLKDKQSRLPLTSMITLSGTEVGPYLCIVLPLRKHCTMSSKTASVKEDVDESAEVLSVDSTSSEDEPNKVVLRFRELTKETVLTWAQYKELRSFSD